MPCSGWNRTPGIPGRCCRQTNGLSCALSAVGRPSAGARETVHWQRGCCRLQELALSKPGERKTREKCLPFRPGGLLITLSHLLSWVKEIIGSNGNRSQPPSPSRMRDFQYGFITMSFVNKLWWENANCSAIIAWWASSNGSLKRTDWNYFGFRNSFVLIFLQSLFSVEGVSEGELLDQGGWFWPVLHLLWVFNQQLFTKCLLPVRQPFWFLGYNRQRWLPYWSLHSGEN